MHGCCHFYGSSRETGPPVQARGIAGKMSAIGIPWLPTAACPIRLACKLEGPAAEAAK